MDYNIFERKIKPLLLYVGSIVAAIMCIAYVIIVFVLIYGFKVSTTLNVAIFSIVNGIVGLLIMQSLKLQGQSFAENLPENKPIIEKYYSNKTKDKKNHSMQYYWITSVIKDILFKAATIAATSFGIVYIMIEGSHDLNLLYLALVNILAFIGFGFVALTRTYDYYNHIFVAYMKEKISEGEIK